MVIKEKWREVVVDYLFIMLGTLILAVGINVFMSPNKI